MRATCTRVSVLDGNSKARKIAASSYLADFSTFKTNLTLTVTPIASFPSGKVQRGVIMGAELTGEGTMRSTYIFSNPLSVFRVGGIDFGAVFRAIPRPQQIRRSQHITTARAVLLISEDLDENPCELSDRSTWPLSRQRAHLPLILRNHRLASADLTQRRAAISQVGRHCRMKSESRPNTIDFPLERESAFTRL